MPCVDLTLDMAEEDVATSPLLPIEDGVRTPNSHTSEVRKRSSPDHDDSDPGVDCPTPKRQRIEDDKIGSPPVGKEHDHQVEAGTEISRIQSNEVLPTSPAPALRVLVEATVDNTPTFETASAQLLQRSCALVLDHVGFDSASKEALEALCGEVDSYMVKLLSYVTESMHGARRSQVVAPDFEYAMRRAGLTSQALKPHLEPPIAASKLHFVYPSAEQAESVPQTDSKLLGDDLSGAKDKATKSYIPKNFPAFPGVHTYKATDVLSIREADPRKIREKATEAARHGEEALRRLVNISKVGDHRGTMKSLEKDTKRRQHHELWAKAMDDLVSGKLNSTGTSDIEEQSVIVDATKQYWRKPVSRYKT